MKKTLSVLLTMALTAVLLLTPVCSVSADVGDNYYYESESNNSMALADAIYDDYTVSGYLSGYDIDYFAFRLYSTSTIMMTCVADYSWLICGLYDSNDNIVAAATESWTSSGSPADSMVVTLSPGLYYLVFLNDTYSSYYNDYTFYFTYTSSGGGSHTHSYSSSVTYPTCEEGGYTYYYCSCGDYYYGSYTSATGHDMSPWYTVPATCEEDGETYRYCYDCDYVESETIPATDHTYTPYVTYPTCTSGGYTTYTCTCGDSYVTNYTSSTGHSYNNSCDASCNSCGAIRAVEHVYSNAADTTCNQCGYVREVMASDAKFVVSTVSGAPGSTVSVTINAENNPGIVSTKVKIYYDTSVMKLVSYEAGDFSASGYSWGKMDKEYFVVNWCDAINPNSTATLLATLNFEIFPEAEPGFYDITIEFSCDDDVYDSDYNTVWFEAVNGGIDVEDSLPGDANGDGRVNNRDLGVLQQYLNEWGNTIDLGACDVNGDGRVNNRDLGVLQQYLNDWDIVLK